MIWAAEFGSIFFSFKVVGFHFIINVGPTSDRILFGKEHL